MAADFFELDPRKLVTRRGEAGHSQSSLAEAVDVSDDTISNWERGKNRPTHATAARLANVLKCCTTDLRKDPAPETPSNPQGSRSVGADPIQAQKLMVGCLDLAPLCEPKPDPIQTRRSGPIRHWFSGPWVDAIKAVGKAMGWQLEWQFAAATLFADETAKRFDLIAPLCRTKRREQDYSFSQPLYRVGLQGVCPKELSPLTKEDLVDGQLRIMVQPGEVGWEYVNDNLHCQVCKNETETTIEALRMLIADTRDLVIADELSCALFLSEKSNAQRFALAFKRPLQMFDVCLAVRRSIGADMERLNKALRVARNTPHFLRREKKVMVMLKDIERCSLEPKSADSRRRP